MTDKSNYLTTAELKKMVEDAEGLLPYASTYVGTYQPILGWTSKTTTKWVAHQVNTALYEYVKVYQQNLLSLATDYVPAGSVLKIPTYEAGGEFSWLTDTLSGVGANDLKQLKLAIDHEDDLDLDGLVGMIEGSMPQRITEDTSRESGSFLRRVGSRIARGFVQPNEVSIQNRNSVIIARKAAGIEALKGLRNNGLLDTYLQEAFTPVNLGEPNIVQWISSLSNFGLGHWETTTESGYGLSPIGFIELYQHYYYDFGSFTGPAIDHHWTAPKSLTEFSERYSTTDYSLAESEQSFEQTNRSESETSEKSNFTEEVKKEISDDFSTGMSAQVGGSIGVWQIDASSNLDYSNHTANSRTTTIEKSTEITKKVSTEIKSKTRTFTRRSREIQTENTKLHRINNDTTEILSYEMRRKLQIIGVEIRHIGTQLCWQIYIDRPGDDVGLAELIHIAKSDDFNTTPPAELTMATFDDQTTTYTFDIPFHPKTEKENDNGDYITRGSNKYAEGHDDSAMRIKNTFPTNVPSPVPGYVLKGVTQKSYEPTDSNHNRPSRWSLTYKVDTSVTNNKGKFNARIIEANFEKQPAVKVTVECLWKAGDTLITDAKTAYESKKAEFMFEKQREVQTTFVAALRERIDLVRSVEKRPFDELRREERILLYRRVIKTLMGNVASTSLHVWAELMRSYFELDKMLYFVAPDWWKPEDHKRGVQLTDPEVITTLFEDTVEGELGPSNRIKFGGEGADRSNNYMITEESEPAPLGSSIGWLLQIDGDNHRNAFLNSPWVKVVLPIRSGKEKKAIEWLGQDHVEGSVGLKAKYIDQDENVTEKTIETKLNEFIDAMRENEDKKGGLALATQEVYENGFNPLGGAIRVGLGDSSSSTDDSSTDDSSTDDSSTDDSSTDDSSTDDGPLELKTVAQWIEVLPTNQIVAVKYPPGDSNPEQAD